MDRGKKVKKTGIITLIACIAWLGYFFFPAQISINPVENIDGVPFPQTEKGIVITEKLAHADVLLNQSVFSRELLLTIEVDAENTQEIKLGIREDPFWLSYKPQEVTQTTQTFRIPLTDKIQEADSSVDLMIFSTQNAEDYPQDFTAIPDEGTEDKTNWLLKSISAKVQLAMPNQAQIKNYIKAQISREKTL